MKPYTIPLKSAGGENRVHCSGKASALASLIKAGLSVPGGFCLSAGAYDRFIDSNGLRASISLELGRKGLSDMRWEEMWDASLRIRNLFLRSKIPGDIRGAVSKKISEFPRGARFAVRSASRAEDGSERSYAGLHESYLNVLGKEDVLEKIKMVWASLWSDAAIAYGRELSLNPLESSMAVIIQEMVFGERSGVVFSVDPGRSTRAVIEAVYGLNKGLVDGEIEPDRWFIDRKTGSTESSRIARHEGKIVPGPRGVKASKVSREEKDRPVLSKRDISKIYRAARKAEEIFGGPQDMEWTIRDRSLFILQARPITTVRPTEEEGRRGFDLSLRRSFENLREMEAKLSGELVPAMIEEAREASEIELADLSDEELAREIEVRSEALDRWKDIYWKEFIPFAHGARLFGRIYNDRVRPDDPFEFIGLLTTDSILSVKRNRELESIAKKISAAAGLKGKSAGKALKDIDTLLSSFIESNSGIDPGMPEFEEEKEALYAIVREIASKPVKKKRPGRRRSSLEKKYFGSFGEKDKPFASELLGLARNSYRLRDDDNIYLERFETNLNEAVNESRVRLGGRCETVDSCGNPEEVMRALRFDDYVPSPSAPEDKGTRRMKARARQLKGQPAGEGVVKGKARVVMERSDLFKVRRGEILVTDSIDPKMTFVVPLASGIVERRGGMLIHGAIIAREYGLPCVTGVPGATELIRTGDTITVDGYFGLVINHGDEEEAKGGRST